MALWGKRDSYALTGTLSVTNGSATVGGTGTLFTVELMPGQTVIIGGVKYMVENIASDTSMTLTSVYEGATNAAIAATGQDAPKNLLFEDVRDVYFVDVTEASVAANKAKGLTSPGWWKYTTYTTDAGAKTKHKAIHLVALAATAAEAGDAADDATVADA